MIQRQYFLLFLILIVQACQTTNSEESRYVLLASKKGQVIEQSYTNGATEESFHNIQSLTKSLMSVLIGIAIDKGFIESESATIDQYFPKEYSTLEDARKKKIRITDLLNQTSGLSWKGYLEHEDWQKSPDQIGYVLQKKMEADPGTVYNYNSGATHLLSVILTKATGKSTLDFAKEYLFEPLAISTPQWELRNDGYHDGSGLGLSMKGKDLLSIGQLLMQNGQWNGQQILSPNWLSKMFDASHKSPTRWGIRKSTHGYCWYQGTVNGTLVNYGMGYGGQFIILVPSKELVMVANHEHDTPNGLDQQIDFLNNKLPGLLEAYN